MLGILGRLMGCIRLDDRSHQTIRPKDSTHKKASTMTASSALRRKLPLSRSIPGIAQHNLLLPWTQSLGHQASARLIVYRPSAPPLTAHLLAPQPQTRLSSNHRPFTSSSAQPSAGEQQEPPSGEDWERLSAEAKIQWCGEDKWGFVVYRRSYAHEFDGGWDDLKRRIQRMRESIATQSDAPSIAERMDFVFVEDATLEGASVEKLQRRFQAWARADQPAVDMDDAQITRDARHEFFLMVDGEGLWGGYVGLVRGWPFSSSGEEDWMKIRASSVDPELYYQLGNPEVWYAYYTPPESGLSTTGW